MEEMSASEKAWREFISPKNEISVLESVSESEESEIDEDIMGATNEILSQTVDDKTKYKSIPKTDDKEKFAGVDYSASSEFGNLMNYTSGVYDSLSYRKDEVESIFNPDRPVLEEKLTVGDWTSAERKEIKELDIRKIIPTYGMNAHEIKQYYISQAREKMRKEENSRLEYRASFLQNIKHSTKADDIENAKRNIKAIEGWKSIAGTLSKMYEPKKK